MAGIKIIGASHPSKFAKEFGRGGVEIESTERYSAEFNLHGHRCRVVHDHTTGEVVIWFEAQAFTEILTRMLSLTEYLGKALVVGIVPGMRIDGDAFIWVPGGEIKLSRAGEGLWIGWDGTNGVFSATVPGIAELISILRGAK
ncbi:hypothetical protein [Thermococcus sp. 21S7]|uniref:hypothetical protein n=1 Tax=Thermococcus sp. 21S7 TaxID=1638221 RepID=UPI00143BA9DB|nr:hypothetical protein [Thermococcus sp. 21S7]NJE61763.1 hypothetical protein [Thermococcus sp. 21S7]